MAQRIPAARPASSAAQAISTRMVQLMARYIGRGPTKARTTLNTNLVVVVLGEVMTKAEQSLAAVGQTSEVRASRNQLHELMREEAREIVEELTGRKVLSVLADLDPVSDCAAVVFILDPIAETGEVDVAEVSAPSRDGNTSTDGITSG
jgi:uncharacterized protein YbcI